MNFITTSLYVALGGGFGAVFRYLWAEGLKAFFHTPGYVAIIIVNIIGCFLIGYLFLLLEATFRRDGKSRLQGTHLEGDLEHLHGPFNEDATLQAVDHFRSDQRLRFVSGFLITGFLGGFTTFSSFCLYSVHLLQSGNLIAAVANISLSAFLSIFAVVFGIWCARKTLILWRVKAPNNQDSSLLK
ncbi:fluoride efflux transporter FluC [Sinobacterium caligoides]|uniref:fluoride efflux transporter FluC n=1 Tax=Sinobacterium caligoides TaxID=933926 RepID=UPI0013C31F09|nr:CrcB family protein [Sinobacterium caligoides]